MRVIMVIKLSGVQFGLKSYAWFQNRTSAQREFDLKWQVWFQTKIARHEVQLPLYYTHFEITQFFLSLRETQFLKKRNRQRCYPKHIKRAIPFSLALRLRRICSSDDTFTKRTTELKAYLNKRGYNLSFLDGEIRRVHNITRTEALDSKDTTQTNQPKRVTLVITYNQEKIRGQRGTLPVQALGYVKFGKVIFRRPFGTEVCFPDVRIKGTRIWCLKIHSKVCL